MTLAELEDTLPNGFHDAFLYGLAVDYKDQEVNLDVELDFGSDDDLPDVSDYKRAEVKISGLEIFIVDPPDSCPQYGTLGGDELAMNGFVTASDEYWIGRIDPKLIKAAGADAPFYSFFVSSWNSCIHIAAKDAVCILKG
jgi:hypothetical protein